MEVTKREYALALDAADPLAKYRELFVNNDSNQCYLDGNSLGRLPKATIKAVSDFITNEWGNEVVAGWAHWIDEAQTVGDLLGRAALGAGPGQVLVCDTTSINFYQLALAAIQARPGRKTIIIDEANFPTDRYILQGIARQFGLNLVTINNEPGETEFERITPEILSKYLSDDVALVTLQVIQYRSGARTPIKEITDLVRKHGALTLWDASHAVGAIEMNFDANGVDLAVGCTYKYGNSGPGSPAWMYVNKKIQRELQVPIQGWFAQRDQFEMGPIFEREMETMRGYQIASPGLMAIRCVKTSFEMIEAATIEAINKKCAIGTEMMIALYDAWLAPLGFTLNTSRITAERGGHISLIHPDAKEIAAAMRSVINVIPDYRVPNSIRLAISPLPTSYTEVWDGFERLRDLVASKKYLGFSDGGSRVT
ncbi:MAG: kynureninase [Candidatus Nanopelagicaceae bacterium]